MRLDNKVVYLTGGASGLGRAVVHAFVAEGARVVVLDKSESGLAALLAEPALATTPERGERVIGHVGDVRNGADHEAAVAQAVAHWGGLDVYVANAGIWDYGRPLARLSFEQIDTAFDEVMSINVKGAMLGARAALPALVPRRGCMVFTLSNAAFGPDGGGPLYTASKHAALGLVRQLAFECAPHVRVNGVAPGAIATDLRGPASLRMEDRSISSLPVGDNLKGNLPIDRWAQPEDYAPSFVYLAAGTESGHATGTVINIDGGFAVRGVGRSRGGDGLDEQFPAAG